MINVPLSVLDLAPVAADGSVGEALRHTTELARRTEEERLVVAFSARTVYCRRSWAVFIGSASSAGGSV
ncbi:hypothetical protein ACNAW0_21100, partial [Micromonospora sp. SL1-18]